MNSLTDPIPTSAARVVDAAVERALRVGSRTPNISVPDAALCAFRRGRVEELLTEHAPELVQLREAVVGREPLAVARFDRLLDSSLAALRSAVPKSARCAFSARLDRALYRNVPEFLDNPEHPVNARVHTLDKLDSFNRYAGSYDAWIEMLEPHLRRCSRRPVRVHDLAAGHGGFALALKERLGPRVEVTASDIKEEYLELGRKRAQVGGLDVRFLKLDAADLSEAPAADVFVCTQSLHHFSAGMIARMLGEAARAATTGVVFIDAERGLLRLLLVTLLQIPYSRTWTSIHDTYASFRRMLLAEELILLSQMAPGIPEGASLNVGRQAPGYLWLDVSLPGGSKP